MFTTAYGRATLRKMKRQDGAEFGIFLLLAFGKAASRGDTQIPQRKQGYVLMFSVQPHRMRGLAVHAPLSQCILSRPAPHRPLRDSVGKTWLPYVPTLTMPRIWPDILPVYDHLGVLLEVVAVSRAADLIASGDYKAVGSRKRISNIVHKGPPDGRDIPDQMALKAKGSSKAHFREKFPSGAQCWSLKDQVRPWGAVA